MEALQDFLRFFRRVKTVRAAILTLLVAVLVLGSFSYLTILPQAAGAKGTPTLSVDGTGLGACNHFTNSCSALLSTSKTNEIVIVYTFENLDLQTSCTFAVSDTAGLSWHIRAQVSGRNDGTTGSNRDQLAEFWAQSANVLSSDNITESILGCASFQYGGEYNWLIAFGVAGANYNQPFDTSTSLPATASGNSGGPALSISARTAQDMIIGAALQSSYGNLAPGPGYNPISSARGVSVAEYQIVNSHARNFPVSFSDNVSWYWEAIGDAVQPATI